MSEAVLNSKLHQWDDGMVFGFSGSASSLMVPAGISSPEHIKNWILAFNNVCLPSTGLTKGIEIVYDFKHQERGIFDYDGNVLNVGTVANAGITHYAGKTRGFVNATYDSGVMAYSGYFISGSLNAGISTPVVQTLGGGVTYIEAAPLKDDTTLNPGGVFATYYGVGGGFSSAPSIGLFSGNGELALTWYTLREGTRSKFAAPTWDKTDTVVRASAAVQMQSEMMMLAKLNLISKALLPQALIELWGFVGNP